MGFILYDTKMLQIRAKECVNADYIQESLNLFLDILISRDWIFQSDFLFSLVVTNALKR